MTIKQKLQCDCIANALLDNNQHAVSCTSDDNDALQ